MSRITGVQCRSATTPVAKNTTKPYGREIILLDVTSPSGRQRFVGVGTFGPNAEKFLYADILTPTTQTRKLIFF